MLHGKLRIVLAGLAVLAVVAVLAALNLHRRHRQPNIAFLLLDTVRADHLGAFGYERDTSPALDAFLRENWNFTNAVTAAPWTPVSVGSIFTGLYPLAHGFMPPGNDAEAIAKGSRLPESADTLAEILSRKGYFTAAITSNPWLKRGFGLNQGFKGFWYLDRESAKEVNRQTYKVLRRLREQDKPFFLYVHYMDPHSPYTPPPPYDSLFKEPLESEGCSDEMQNKMSLYDGEIRFLDDAIDNLFSHLKKSGLWKDLIVVIVSDHGEQFDEHGHQGHGFTLHNEELHVVLGIKAPGRKKQETASVSLVDVFPTVLDLAGQRIPEKIDGVSLVSRLDDRVRRPVLSEIKRVRNMKSLRDQAQKHLIVEYDMTEDFASVAQEAGDGSRLLYDLRSDYRGESPLDDSETTERLTKALVDTCTESAGNRLRIPAGPLKIKPATLKELKGLGYF